jgi:hypothetical protein
LTITATPNDSIDAQLQTALDHSDFATMAAVAGVIGSGRLGAPRALVVGPRLLPLPFLSSLVSIHLFKNNNYFIK